MKPFIKESDVIAYITERQFAEFAANHSEMSVAEAENYFDQIRIFSCTGKTFWSKDSQFTKEQGEWLNLFFKNHPFIKNILLTYED